ncbi:hypothetical protein [Seleniivibrio sp.]|uniref:hypothetical protein n=1 Tax=Seleniivibrio sp. TaxID=2898801 RepID=UPI0025D7A945|nr:hypothetical protein [Seleniivibrio sp.]MCD8554672.1 hypothetical protein [Seleniivibrio sp.]
MKKNSATDLFSQLSDDEMQRIVILKNGLEDLNLILQEIEDTYNKLAEIGITEQEKKNQRLRLLTLEKYLLDLNEKVNSAMGTADNKSKLS